MIKQNEIKMKLKFSSWPMYMEEICIIQIQRPSRAGADFYFGVQKKIITY
jgi:hypothetical protein